MKKIVLIIIFFLLSLNLYSQTRQYVPVSDRENQFYQNFDRNVWPNDVRQDINLYNNILVGWVGIVEKFMIDTSNEEYNILGLFLRHHYYDWIENFRQSTPINLSPNGEGYFIVYYLAIKDFNITELTEDIIGNLIINYGYPIEIDEEDGTITLTTQYMRLIGKEYVNPNFLPYGRSGLGGMIIGD